MFLEKHPACFLQASSSDMSIAIFENTNRRGFIFCDKHAVLFTFQSEQTRNHPLKHGDLERIFLIFAGGERHPPWGCSHNSFWLPLVLHTTEKRKPQWMRLQAPEGENSQALSHHGTLFDSQEALGHFSCSLSFCNNCSSIPVLQTKKGRSFSVRLSLRLEVNVDVAEGIRLR